MGRTTTAGDAPQQVAASYTLRPRFQAASVPTDNGEGRAPPVSEDEAPRLAPRHQLRPRNQGVFFAVTDNGEGRAPLPHHLTLKI